jgi:single-stranded-DNA-specific exonuclease
VPGADLGQAVRRALAEGIALKGGGHAMAAGVTLKRNDLSRFRAFLEQQLSAVVETARRGDALLIDGALSAGAANAELIATLQRAGPFGSGNAEPVLALPSHTLIYADVVGEKHIRARLRSGDGTLINAIAFRAANEPLGNALVGNRGHRVHVAGALTLDRWQGEERVQFRLIDMAEAENRSI